VIDAKGELLLVPQLVELVLARGTLLLLRGAEDLLLDLSEGICIVKVEVH
jgi:hypothetical protein